jgi:hypothetical protein
MNAMERRHFLKLSVGFIAGSVALAVSAQAAVLPPIAAPQPSPGKDVEPAVVGQQEVDRLKPEGVRWGHHGHGHGHWHRHWHRRHWGWHRHRWHRRHWGHRHWHRHHW